MASAAPTLYSEGFLAQQQQLPNFHNRTRSANTRINPVPLTEAMAAAS
jgi:hypothetical protein